VDQSNVRYGVTVRFEKVNYQGVNSNNYAVDELIEGQGQGQGQGQSEGEGLGWRHKNLAAAVAGRVKLG
jgi:hypothetical protein